MALPTRPPPREPFALHGRNWDRAPEYLPQDKHKKVKVMVIDPNQESRDAVLRCLRAEGHEYAGFEGGMQARCRPPR